MKYFKGVLIFILLAVIAIQSILLVYLVKVEKSYGQVMAYAGAIGELQKALQTINENGANYYERAIVIRLAMNKVLLDKYIEENKSTIPKDIREKAINVANNAVPKKSQP